MFVHKKCAEPCGEMNGISGLLRALPLAEVLPKK
jgi:hypothetical protein